MSESEITKIDPTTYGFLKAKMSSEIASDIKASLFRQYWVWLAGFSAGVAVLGIVSVTKLIPDLAQHAAETFIESTVKPQVDNAKTQMSKAQTQIDDAEKSVVEARKRFDATMSETAIRLEDVRQTVANMKRYSEDAEQELRTLRSRILDNQKAVGEVRSELIESIKKDLVTAPNFEAASNRIAETADELLKLKTELAEIQRRLSISTASTPQESARVESLKKIIETAAAKQSEVVPTRSATVFIQFAVFSRDIIKTVSSGLKELGWTVPPEERVEAALNQRAVRYYYEEDAPKAKQLAADVADQIKQAGYTPVDLLLQPLLNFPKKPKAGTLEVWLGIAPSKAQP